MSDLPPDAIGDILSRLPVKSVCRFKCVSKLWLRLTHEPHFIAAHLNRHQKQKVILSSARSLFSLDPEAPIDDDMLPSELDFPLKSDLNNNWIQMFGSCNGLVCIMPQPEVFFVFNPSTRESMRIPDCPRQNYAGPPNGAGFHIHSFGYAPSANDYKFIKIFYGRIVLVFSLKSKTWKTVQDFPFNRPLNDPGTPLNGVMHWFCLGLGGPPVIAAFDLSEEKMSGLPPPESIGESQSLVTGALRGCLCLLYCNDPNRQRTFWIMNEYGVKESWTKILIAEPYFMLKPLCNWKNSKILVARNMREILLFNQRDGTCKNLLANGLQVPFHADVYVESLVSPNILQN